MDKEDKAEILQEMGNDKADVETKRKKHIGTE